jgi:hypothetical protein
MEQFGFDHPQVTAKMADSIIDQIPEGWPEDVEWAVMVTIGSDSGEFLRDYQVSHFASPETALKHFGTVDRLIVIREVSPDRWVAWPECDTSVFQAGLEAQFEARAM